MRNIVVYKKKKKSMRLKGELPAPPCMQVTYSLYIHYII